MTTATQINGQNITSETYFVFYGEHDKGDSQGFMVREGIENARRTEQLLDQCGYRRIEIQYGMDLIRG